MDKAGRNKRVYQTVQLELADPIGIKFTSFVAYHDNL
ncbi:MAG: hypothetical protein JWL90_1717 [Chthoniobacteraceae bacterium]|nr:hypothetical protein [Chthoniobacteraceae bacterium]